MPLAAAVSGKATRSLGVWQGSAAQQAQEMVPEGVTVVSALHTVGAPTLADLDATLDEDVLVCGDKKARQGAASRALIERIDGLRAVNAGPLEMARIAEQLTPLLISINVRYKAHAGLKLTGPARRRPLGVKRVVVLAGGTGGAKLAAGLQEIARRRPDGDRQHRRRHRGPRRPRLPRPGPLHLLAQRRDRRRARLGDRGDSFRVFERLMQLGAPDWFGLSDRDLATCLRAAAAASTHGERQTDGPARARARARGRGATVLPMCDEPVRTRVRTPDGWREFQEYLVRDGAEPRDRGGRAGGHRGGAADARGPRRRSGAPTRS